jgi:hypothetical protein
MRNLSVLWDTLMFLSLDRNLFISRPLTYSLCVTKMRIKIMILISWSLPVVIGLLTFFTTNLDEVKMCIPTHTSSRWPNFVTAVLVFLTINAVYMLYVKILVSYWGLKRKLSTIRKHNRGDEHDQKRKLEIAKKVHKIVVFLKNSKYVTIVISTFTICWIPWILNVFYDILFHQLGSYQHSVESHCRIFTEETFHLHINIYEEFQGRNFISDTKATLNRFLIYSLKVYLKLSLTYLNSEIKL